MYMEKKNLSVCNGGGREGREGGGMAEKSVDLIGDGSAEKILMY